MTVSVSGATISFTFKTPGTIGNINITTDSSTQFPDNPSFPAQYTTLTGGRDPQPGTLSSPYVTLYQYDTLNNLLCVHQKGTDTTADKTCNDAAVPATWRPRVFTYDSLSRLMTATNPESGTISHAYDNNGNMASKTAPAPNQTGSAIVFTTYTYDNLNRLTDKSYNDGATPTASFRYDYASFMGHAFENPVGREVAALTANSTVGYFMSYDMMGRVKQTTQCLPGVAQCQSFSGSYDQLGDLLTLGYPGAGFTVTYGYDAAARLTSATDSSGVIYAQSPTILASGAMQEFVSPNFSSNKFHADFNSRLQPTEIWAGPSAGANALFDKKYTYNAPNTSQMNNGNVYTVTNAKDDSRTQSFTYDALNRLLSAGDKTHWANTYVYDAWGNLYQKIPGSPAGESLLKVADSNNRLSGITYDAAGNVVNDGTGNTFVYDAENRIISVTNNGATTTYTYHADGRRVKKSSGTNYWYGLGGETLAETDASGNFTNYIYFAGQRLARNIPQPSPNPADIKYYVTDHLHSTAVFADKSGTVLDDNDFYPWGGVVPGVGTTSSNNHYRFTGKERDTESQLDYFGARYYANITGRFMNPDWAAKPTSVPYAVFGDPQSLNLYSYVRNSPVVRVDADGHMPAILDSPMVARGDGMQWGWGDSGWTETTITYTDGHTVTIVHPTEGCLTAEQARKQGQQQAQPQKNPGVPVVLPNGSIVSDSHSATGTLMSPVADLSPVAAAGSLTYKNYLVLLATLGEASANAFLIASLGANVGTGGTFDYQRSGNIVTGFKQQPQFRDVSNFNVGLFTQKAGLTLVETLTIAGKFAANFSSNADTGQAFGLAPRTAEFIVRGYFAGASFY